MRGSRFSGRMQRFCFADEELANDRKENNAAAQIVEATHASN
jgi:hypothetical protein